MRGRIGQNGEVHRPMGGSDNLAAEIPAAPADGGTAGNQCKGRLCRSRDGLQRDRVQVGARA